MFVVFEQVLILFIFMATGFTLSKLGIVKFEHSKILSALLVYVISPCNAFSAFSSNFTLAYIKENYILLIAALIVILSMAAVAYFAAKLFTKNKYDRNVYEYSLVMANYGYMGYVLAASLFGELGMLNLMVFSIPASIYVYVYGYAKLSKRGFSLVKMLNPVIISMFLGMVVGLLGIPIPNVIMSVASSANSCMGPVSMLLAGIVVSEFKVGRLLVNPKAYVVSFFRLFGIPVVLGLIMKALGVTGAVFVSVMLFVSMPCGMNTIIFPRMVDENCEIGASLALISNVLACISIPVVFTLFGVGG